MLIDIMNRQCIGHEVFLIIINRENNPELLQKIDSRVDIRIIGRKRHTYNPLPVVRFNTVLRRIAPDIVHMHNPHIMPLLFRKWRDCRFVFTAHTTTGIMQAGRFHKIFAISHSVQEYLWQRYGKSTPVQVIYNGIDTQAIAHRAKGEAPGKMFRIIQVGRLAHRQKGQDITLEALHILTEKYGVSSVSVDFIGEGASMDFLSEKAREYHIENRVSFLGNRDRSYIYDHLHEYDLLVQPSRVEGFGLTVAEGIAAGVPVLVSDVAGPMEIIEQGKWGTSFAQDNAADCAEKIHYILSRYAEVSEKAEAAAKAIRKFDISLTASNYINAYAELIGRRE